MLSGESDVHGVFVLWSMTAPFPLEADFHSFKFVMDFANAGTRYVLAGWPQALVGDDTVDDFGFAYIAELPYIETELDMGVYYYKLALVVTVNSETDVTVTIDQENSEIRPS